MSVPIIYTFKNSARAILMHKIFKMYKIQSNIPPWSNSALCVYAHTNEQKDLVVRLRKRFQFK